MLVRIHQEKGAAVTAFQLQEDRTFDDLELFLYMGGVAFAHAFLLALHGVYDIPVIAVFAQVIKFAVPLAVLTVLLRWWRRLP